MAQKIFSQQHQKNASNNAYSGDNGFNSKYKYKYIIGIDLGTTNSAVAYVNLAEASSKEIRIGRFEPLQLITKGHTGRRSALPSFLYLTDEKEREDGELALPWDSAPLSIAGEFAKIEGIKRPQRVVSSAKSWLCHGGVERKAKILPWGIDFDEGCQKVSPVEASSAYLRHIRMAWNAEMDAPMEEQMVILTVPASFDEVARELTIEAAKEAGFKDVTLLEEPLSAFYSWLSQNETVISKRLSDNDLILVCDVGGGTTDFTLIRCNIKGGAGDSEAVTLDRVAVGEHLLLGGDNIDLAITMDIEKAIKKELTAIEWHSLLNEVRSAKESLFNQPDLEKATIRLSGRGRGLVAGTITYEIKKDDLLSRIVDGFFPQVGFNEDVSDIEGHALKEMGLPYEKDPAITRHLQRFLRLQGKGALPTHILFNGGALKPEPIRRRIEGVINHWRSECGKDGDVRPLESESLDLAISIGAAYFGLSKIGLGLKVGGGIPRAYYIGIRAPSDGEERVKSPQKGDCTKAFCIIPHGTEEGEIIEPDTMFKAFTNRPVSFKLYFNTIRKDDNVSDIVSTKELHELPPLVTVLKYGKKSEQKGIPVRLSATVTPIGTLELFCKSINTPHRWRLQFELRKGGEGGHEKDVIGGEIPSIRANMVEGVRIKGDKKGEMGEDALRERLSSEDRDAIKRLEERYNIYFKELSPDLSLSKIAIDTLEMDKTLWRLPMLRAVADILIRHSDKRGRSKTIEAQWFNMLGFTMRPGVGDELDPWRIKSLWPVWFKGIFYPSDPGVRLQWWIFWRRIAGGLGPGQQEQIFGRVVKAVFNAPQKGGRKKTHKKKQARKGQKITNEEAKEIIYLIGNLEKVSPSSKIDIARSTLLQLKGNKLIKRDNQMDRLRLWLIGRLGARHLLYGNQERVVPPSEAFSWIKQIMAMEIEPTEGFFRNIVAMSRLTGDRARDLLKRDREDIKIWLESLGANHKITASLAELQPLEQKEINYAFGEELPVGISLMGDI